MTGQADKFTDGRCKHGNRTDVTPNRLCTERGAKKALLEGLPRCSFLVPFRNYSCPVARQTGSLFLFFIFFLFVLLLEVRETNFQAYFAGGIRSGVRGLVAIELLRPLSSCAL